MNDHISKKEELLWQKFINSKLTKDDIDEYRQGMQQCADERKQSQAA